MSQGFVVRLRGLPWSASKDEINRFLVECRIAGGDEGIHFTFSREGRPSGEAFVELESEDDVNHALAQNHEHIGSRYIEVFRVDRSEMEYTIKHSGAGAAANSRNPDAVLKLRGLPFNCSKEEISQFLAGCHIVPNGIMFPEDQPGRRTGEAYVQFSSPDEAEKALKKHNERIAHRYIEIFKSSLAEANNNTRGGMMRQMMMPRPGPYDRGDRGFGMGGPMGPMGVNIGFGRGRGRNLKGFYEDEYDDFMGFGMRDRRGRGGMARGGGGGGAGGRGGMGGAGGGMMDRGNRMMPGSMYISKTGHSVHMRGLPFDATNDQVFEFFAPLQPVRCEFDYGDNGRPTGEANVDFVTHQEALDAMKKHKQNIGHRYIELFLNSEPAASRGNSGGGGGYGNGMGGFGGNDEFTEDIGPAFGSGSGFGGGYSAGSSNQGFGSQGGAGGYGGQGGMNSYDLGGGYGDGGMRNNSNYSAF